MFYEARQVLGGAPSPGEARRDLLTPVHDRALTLRPNLVFFHCFFQDADRFLVNYSWLASQMSAEEVEACAAQLRLFRAIDVSIVPEYVELNGRWSYNREPPLRRAPATSWLCTAGARTRSSLGVSSRLGQNINAGGVARDPDAQQAGRTHK